MKAKNIFLFIVFPLSAIVLLAGLWFCQKQYSDWCDLAASATEAQEKGEDAETEHDYVGAEKSYLTAVEVAAKVESGRTTWFDSILGHRNSEEQALRDLAGLYERQGRYVDAEPLQKRMLVIQELRGLHPWSNDGLVALAGDYNHEGRYAQSEALYKRALEVVAKEPHNRFRDSINDWDELRNLDALAELYCKQGRYAEAESLVKRIQAINQSICLSSPAILFSGQGKYADAEKQCLHTIAISEKELSEDDSPDRITDVAKALNDLAGVYAKQGKYLQAENIYKRAIKICESSVRRPVDADSRRTRPDDREWRRIDAVVRTAMRAMCATSLADLGALYRSEHKNNEAEILYRRALVIDEKELGTSHPDYAQVLCRLAELSCEQSKYELAESMFKRALVIDEKALGENGPDKVGILKSYAVLLRKTDREADAVKLDTQAETIKSQVASH